MRTLIGVVLAAALAWSGYWIVGASQVKARFAEALSQDGQVTYSDLSLQGFPNRFDTTISDLAITSRDGPATWSVPFLQVLSLSYNPTHIIAVLANEQRFEGPDEAIDVTSESLRASVVLDDIGTLEMNRGTLIGQSITFQSSLGERVDLGSVTSSLRRVGASTRYDIALDADGITFAELDDIGPTRAEARITAELAQPLIAAPGAPVAVTSLAIDRMRVVQGETSINISGELPVDAAGLMAGELSVEIRNWREILANLSTARILSAAAVSNLTTAIGIFALNPADPDTLKLRLTIRQGQMFLGPIPLGAAPRLIWNQD